MHQWIYSINGPGVCPYQWVCKYHIPYHTYDVYKYIYIYKYKLQHIYIYILIRQWLLLTTWHPKNGIGFSKQKRPVSWKRGPVPRVYKVSSGFRLVNFDSFPWNIKSWKNGDFHLELQQKSSEPSQLQGCSFPCVLSFFSNLWLIRDDFCGKKWW